MPLAPELLAVLRCPESRGELIYFHNGIDGDPQPFLLCPTSRLRYAIDEAEGHPIMLIEEAQRLDEPTCQDLIAKARAQGLSVP